MHQPGKLLGVFPDRSLTPMNILRVFAAISAAVGLQLSAGFAQVTIFAENVGTPAATTLITSYTGWQNNGVLTFGGTGDVRTSTPSTGYTGASGSGNVFLTNNGSSTFIISGINTTGFLANSFSLTFGAHKSTTASNMSELSLAYSTDGTTYTSIAIPIQATGTGTAVWRSINISGLDLPLTSNLYLRWTNTSTSPQFRLDDISLSATAIPEPSTYAAIFGALALAGVMIHRRRKQA